MRVAFTMLALLASLAVVGEARAQGRPATEVTITAPSASTIVVGTAELSAAVTTTPAATVRSVEFFVDGVPACTAPRAPFTGPPST